MKKRIAALIVASVMTVSMSGCGKSTPAASTQAAASTAASASTSTAASSTEASTTTEASSSTEAEETSVDGVVIDAAMHSLTLQTKDGQTLSACTSEDNEPDVTGLKDGLSLGKGITLTYTGDASKDDVVTIVKEADCDTKFDDADALSAAGDIILSVENKDLDSIVSSCSYPVYVGIGDGLTIKDEEDFKKQVKSEDLFTEALVDSVSHVDLLDLEECKAGLVLSSGKDDSNDIILSKDKDGSWKITGINFGK